MADGETFSPEDIVLASLQETGRLSAEDVASAESLSRESGTSLLTTLNQIGAVNDDDLATAYQRVTELRIVSEADLAGAVPCMTLGLGQGFMKRMRGLMLTETGPLALVDPLNQKAIEGVEFVCGTRPEIVIAKSGDWARVFTALHEQDLDLTGIGGEDVSEMSATLADNSRDAPIVRRVAAWLSEAADLGASDIHFDARRTALEVRYRVDGVLQTVAREPKSASASVLARIKVLADLDLGERNRSQDGRATVIVRGRRLDIRVSVISTIDGESAVIRLLDRPATLLSVEKLGFPDDVASGLHTLMHKRNGLFVVAGPTGSGKTTTLYACLEQLKGSGLKILSVEDPVEYHFEHVNQVQISAKEGRSFAGAIKSFLRHDPDVILVGEIRDSETAKIAVEAALQGHLVLATLHAIDVARIETRLLDMGVEPFQLEATIAGRMAQRLVRLLCSECKSERPPTGAEASVFEEAGLAVPETLCHPQGCGSCRDEGYVRRLAVAELVHGHGGKYATTSLKTQGLALVARGQTSLQEIISLDVD